MNKFSTTPTTVSSTSILPNKSQSEQTTMANGRKNREAIITFKGMVEGANPGFYQLILSIFNALKENDPQFPKSILFEGQDVYWREHVYDYFKARGLDRYIEGIE